MAIQRHIKILGIFVRLFERDGKSGYLKDLPRVMWYLLEESRGYHELDDFMAFIHSSVMPKFIENMALMRLQHNESNDFSCWLGQSYASTHIIYTKASA